MSEPEDQVQARAIIDQWQESVAHTQCRVWQDYWYGFDKHLAAALRAQRAAALEEAARYIDEEDVLTAPDELDAACKCKCFDVLGRISNHFRARAQQAREGWTETGWGGG